MTLPGYSIDDVDLQDTLLDAVEVAVDEIIAASWELIPFWLLSVSLRQRQRIYNTALVIQRVTVLELAPQSYLPHHHEIDGRRQVAPGTTRTVLLGKSERFP